MEDVYNLRGIKDNDIMKAILGAETLLNAKSFSEDVPGKPLGLPFELVQPCCNVEPIDLCWSEKIKLINNSVGLRDVKSNLGCFNRC